MHGVVMVFFFLIPSIPATLGNFFLPMMIGARDLAFPRINLLSWYLLVIGGLFAIFAMVAGGVDTGWTFYTPYSTSYSNTWVIATALGIFIAGFSSILTGLNFIVTVHRMRAPGLTWFRLPLFVWAHYATALIQVLGTPVLAVTLALVFCERVFHIGIFDPALGGDPVLFQHLFWFYSHPAVYIMILPAMGVMSELVSCFPASRFSATASWPSPAWPSRCSASWSGATTCSSPASRCTPAWSSRSSATSWPSLRPSRCSTGRPPCTRAPSPTPRPCSTPSASSACSPSAG